LRPNDVENTLMNAYQRKALSKARGLNLIVELRDRPDWEEVNARGTVVGGCTHRVLGVSRW
jgi:hypothetical protein